MRHGCRLLGNALAISGAACALALSAACSSTGGVTDGGSSGDGGTGASSTGGAAASHGGAAGATASTGTGGHSGAGAAPLGGGGSFDGGGVSDALPEGCASVSATASRIPLTIYFLIDHSSSMAGTKWDAASSGLSAVLNDPGSKDITVGLALFPRDTLLPGQPECSFQNYQDPLVAFGKLPAQAKAMTDAIAAAAPNGYGTPIYPALGGGLTRALTMKQAAPKENFVVLLVTDGEPEPPPGGPDSPMCGTADPLDAAAIDQLAATAFAMYGVKTFVVGLPGVNAGFANALAMAGGSDAAIIIANVDVQKSFQDALAKVRGEGLGCVFPLPSQDAGMPYSYDQVNVRYTDGGTGGATDLLRSPGCQNPMGWDYDDVQMPTEVILCAGICDTVKKDGLAKIEIVLGCPTNVY